MQIARCRHIGVGMAKPLTEKQEKFIELVAAGYTHVQAFKDAGYSWERYDAEKLSKVASDVAMGPRVSARLDELRQRRRDVAEAEFDVTVKKLLLTFFEIAFTDPNELISVRQGACRHCWGVGGHYQWKEREYVRALAEWEKAPKDKATGELPPVPDCAGGFGYRFTAQPNPECDECEGEGMARVVTKDTTQLSAGARHLYRGVQQTKDGIKILFADKDAALDRMVRILGGYDDRMRLDLKGSVAALQLTTSDPQEAARAYERMIQGG